MSLFRSLNRRFDLFLGLAIGTFFGFNVSHGWDLAARDANHPLYKWFAPPFVAPTPGITWSNLTYTRPGWSSYGSVGSWDLVIDSSTAGIWSDLSISTPMEGR